MAIGACGVEAARRRSLSTTPRAVAQRTLPSQVCLPRNTQNLTVHENQSTTNPTNFDSTTTTIQLNSKQISQSSHGPASLLNTTQQQQKTRAAIMSQADHYETLEKIGECSTRCQSTKANTDALRRTWLLRYHQESSQKGGWADPLSQGDQLCQDVAKGKGTTPRRVPNSLLSPSPKYSPVLRTRTLQVDTGPTSIYGILRQWGFGARHQGPAIEKDLCRGRVCVEHVCPVAGCPIQMSLRRQSPRSWRECDGAGKLCETTKTRQWDYDFASGSQA